MLRKFDLQPGAREAIVPLNKNTEYCVSGSGTFTVEILRGPVVIYGAVLREDYIQLPRFSEDVRLRLIGRDMMTFTVYVSDDKMF